MSYYLVLPFVLGVIKNENGEVLIGKHPISDTKPYPGWWDVPGGKLEKNETIEVCLVREIAEETGYDVVEKKFLGAFHHNFEKKRKENLDFIPGLAHCYEVKIEGDFKPAEMDEWRWVTKEELEEYQLTPWAKHFLLNK